MLTFALVPLTCWLCALLALPRRPLPGNEVQELVYARLLGRQQRLVLLALVVSVVVAFAVVVHLPGIALSDTTAIGSHADTIGGSAVCETGASSQVCYVPRLGGMWAVERWQPDGAVVIEDLVPVPPAGG